MVKAVKKFITLLLFFLFWGNCAEAETKAPAPKPTVKATVKATAKSTTATKRVNKRYVRKRVAPIPSPSAKWPPANFNNSGSIYAKIPSASELNSFASNSRTLSAALKDCEKLTCGAIFLAAVNGCNWWQIDSVVTSPSKTTPGTRDTLGTLRTLASGSSSKKVIAVILKSSEPLQDGVTVGGITARCWSSAAPDNVPSDTYTPIPTPTNSSN